MGAIKSRSICVLRIALIVRAVSSRESKLSSPFVKNSFALLRRV
jgi:hypothetical protein